jgi:hypothetical protein
LTLAQNRRTASVSNCSSSASSEGRFESATLEQSVASKQVETLSPKTKFGKVRMSIDSISARS